MPHAGSVEFFPAFDQHVYARTFGPDPNSNPPFDGFEVGTQYRAKIERLVNGEWEFVHNVDWTQAEDDI